MDGFVYDFMFCVGWNVVAAFIGKQHATPDVQLLEGIGADTYDAGHADVEHDPLLYGYNWFGTAVHEAPGTNACTGASDVGPVVGMMLGISVGDEGDDVGNTLGNEGTSDGARDGDVGLLDGTDVGENVNKICTLPLPVLLLDDACTVQLPDTYDEPPPPE